MENTTMHGQPRPPGGGRTPQKRVYTIIDKGEGQKAFWCSIGAGWVNRDGSFNLLLDALPVNGKLQVRDWEPREERSRSTPGGGGQRMLPPHKDGPADAAEPMPF